MEQGGPEGEPEKLPGYQMISAEACQEFQLLQNTCGPSIPTHPWSEPDEDPAEVLKVSFSPEPREACLPACCPSTPALLHTYPHNQ